MFKKLSRLSIICIGVVLFVLCSVIGMTSIFYAFAEEGTNEQPQVYEESEDIDILSSETNDSDDK